MMNIKHIIEFFAIRHSYKVITEEYPEQPVMDRAIKAVK